jgi:Flp pilus assembly protein TadG
MPHRRDRRASGEPARGQVLVIFAVALVAMLAMVGLVLDGGATYAQRRDQQNVADVAALAGANDYLLNKNTSTAIAKALEIAEANGYEDGVGGVEIDVDIDLSPGATVTVGVTKPHRNNFAGIVGLGQWDVSTTASALTGYVNTGIGAAPMIFSIDAFDINGKPLPQYANPSAPFPFGDTNNDAPETPGDFAWTNYGTGNVNTNQVRQIIRGELVLNKTIDFGDYIGQHNQGNHTALYKEVDDYLSGTDVPVPVVDHEGHFLGWAMFHVVSAQGGSAKDVNGYFLSDFTDARLTVGECTPSPCDGSVSGQFSNAVLKLVD